MTKSTGSNTRRIEPKQLVTMALFVALGVVVSFVEVPLIPAAPFLKYDPSSILMLISGLIYGPLAGAVVTVATCLLHWSPDGIIGVIMNVLISLAFVVPASALFKRKRSLFPPLGISVVLMVATSISLNLALTPLYLGIPFKEVLPLVVPVLLPFNLIKALINTILAALLYMGIIRVVPRETFPQ